MIGSLGVVLATQNPVDVDYKGLSNAGTWIIGKLQQDGDRERVLGGLEGALQEGGGTLDRAWFSGILGSLKPRQFLLHNVHTARHIVMQSRFAMSYLRGPFTKAQIGQLMALSLIHISEPTRLRRISYAVFCLSPRD